MVINFL